MTEDYTGLSDRALRLLADRSVRLAGRARRDGRWLEAAEHMRAARLRCAEITRRVDAQPPMRDT